MTNELSGQTDTTVVDTSTVDVQTPADGGQSAPLVQKDSAAANPNETEEQKKNRISQTEWQRNVEKAKELDELAVTLGIKPGEKVKVVEVLQSQIADLKSENLKSAFEATVPTVKTEKYAEAWKNITDAKKHLVQKGELTYEDLWKMIRDEGEYKQQTAAVQETQKEEQVALSGSVPFFGNSIASQESDKLSGMDKEIARGMGWTEKNYQAAGVL